MEFSIGVGLALAIGVFATAVGFERDRAFYPTVLIVIASYYELFAIIAGSAPVLAAEAAAFALFLIGAVIGFRSNLWIVVGALAAHAVFDFGHGLVHQNPGVPPWWPMFCAGYDLTAAGYLAWRLARPRSQATETAGHSAPVDRFSGYFEILRARFGRLGGRV